MKITLPDHQIVVKLNKEQFEEAQRLAKVAGLRSATAYVRERVLEILQNPEKFNELGELASELPYRIRGVDNEIERIQKDLQQFINESDYSSQGFNDLVNETPDFQFEPEPLKSPPKKEAEETIDLSSQIDSSLTDAVFDTTSNTIENRVEASNYRSDEVEKNVWRSEPQEDKTDELEEEEMQAALNSEPLPRSQKDSPPEMQEVLDAVDEANDELEEMADRAFSISPRLGIIESSGDSADEEDPLADLLDEHLIDKLVLPANQIDIEEPDPTTQEEASHWGTTAPPEEEEKEVSAPPETEEDEIDEDDSTTSQNDSGVLNEEQPKVEFETSENYDLEELKKLQEELNEVASGKSEDKKSDRDEDEEDDEPKFHDVSGGPPPKRRKN